MKKHIWKVFEFSGWFITLIGIIFGLLYASIAVQAELVGGIMLAVVGIAFILIGEFLLEKQEKSKYKMVWHAMSIGGAFALVIGIIWLVIQFFDAYDSWFSVILLLALGVGLILIGEAVKLNK
jgi:nicotinamide riboside transporter PnuC